MHGVGGDKSFCEQPGEEGGEADVVVEEGFGGYGLVEEELAEDGRGEGGEGEVGGVFEEFVEGVGVVGYGVGGEAAGLGVECEALYGLGEGEHTVSPFGVGM